jgi:L,D-peptidoglycan transpeptidase YkuD (ErfK/YbiS/YcfS/YnhG family)
MIGRANRAGRIMVSLLGAAMTRVIERRRDRAPAMLLRVHAISAARRHAVLCIAGRCYPCVLGRAGIARLKREGDGGTPAGAWPLRLVLYRADRVRRPPGALAALAIGRADGWSDDAASPRYNRPVELPRAGRHEALWREDGLYDLVVVLGYNDRPVVRGRGSAVFLHVARPDRAPSEGCVALGSRDLRRVLASVTRRAKLVIG